MAASSSRSINVANAMESLHVHHVHHPTSDPPYIVGSWACACGFVQNYSWRKFCVRCKMPREAASIGTSRLEHLHVQVRTLVRLPPFYTFSSFFLSSSLSRLISHGILMKPQSTRHCWDPMRCRWFVAVSTWAVGVFKVLFFSYSLSRNRPWRRQHKKMKKKRSLPTLFLLTSWVNLHY